MGREGGGTSPRSLTAVRLLLLNLALMGIASICYVVGGFFGRSKPPAKCLSTEDLV